MKSISILVSILFMFNTGFSQTDSTATTVPTESSESTDNSESMKIYGSLLVDFNKANENPVLFGARLGINAILKNNIYLSINYYSNIYVLETISENEIVLIEDVNPLTIDQESISSLKEYSFKFGYSNNTSEKFRITPYIGLGYQIIERTTNKIDKQFTTIHNLNTSSQSIESHTYYKTEDLNSIVVPIGVDFHWHGSKAGFIFSPYINISKYVSAGFNLGVTFGKI